MSHDRQKQSSLDRFLVKVKPGEPQLGKREKTPECQITEVLLEADSPSKQHLLSTILVSTRLFSAR
jgi:hypothetical protein